ncbi:MAG: oligosaccharide flippase family protein [Candidatus Lokiarchaeota archaeon]|nr:oligosaccharide flippase family protein [Candidatus Lokiarchaeota archaeon]MBD3199113.1 oligosaccharide flippase family protein [Candidatus Lokiarchaeota archaeon]
MIKFKNKTSTLFVICLITLILTGGTFFFLFLTPTMAQTTNQKDILVISGGKDQKFIQSISIDTNNFNVTRFLDTETLPNFAMYDVVVLFDANLSFSQINNIGSYVDAGGTCLIFMGPKLHTNSTLLKTLHLITASATLTKNTISMLSLVNNTNNPISRNMDWNSAPDLKPNNMSQIDASELNITADRIIDVYPSDKSLNREQFAIPFIAQKTKGSGSLALFLGWLQRDPVSEDNSANIEFTVWPYFNYLLYGLTLNSMNPPQNIDTYAQWPFSPVPHFTDQIVLLIVVLVLGALAIALFLTVKRKSSSRIDQETIEALKKRAEEEMEVQITEREELKKKLEEKGREDLKDDWEVIGIHRQLGGFLFTFFIGLLLVVPQLLLTSYILPLLLGYTYPQASGWYNYAYNLFQIAWLLFDFGTSFALAKYFSEYRVHNPEKAIHYIQIFVWWQLFTGLAQVSIFALLGSIVFPLTNLAHMSWIFVMFSLVQYPGFFLVFMYTFQGLQRADLHLITYVSWEIFWLLIGQAIFCYLGRLWGAANPIFGEALGAGIGYALARYFDYWATFFFSLYLFKKQGYSPSTCFRADFTKDEFKETMSYGSKLAFGQSFVQIGWFIQTILISFFVANYTQELGYYQLAWTVGMMIQIIVLYGQSLLGAYSEAHSHDKKELTKLYIYEGFRWGNYFGYFLISVLFAVGGLFLVGAAGSDIGIPASQYLPLILVFHGLGIYSWLVDAVFQGTGKTGYAAAVWILEQAIRAIIMWLLVSIFNDMIWVIIAYWPAVFTKDVVAWIIVKYKVSDFKLYPFKTFITPFIAALINFFLLGFFGNFVFNLDLGDKIINTALVFLLGIFIFIFLYAFIEGLLGGYDDNTLEEFEKASQMVTIPLIGNFARGIYKSARLGARISPLHNKFPVDIYEDGMKEAFELTLEKRRLEI